MSKAPVALTARTMVIRPVFKFIEVLCFYYSFTTFNKLGELISKALALSLSFFQFIILFVGC